MLVIRKVALAMCWVWGMATLTYAQCDSFHIDFDMYDGDKPIKVCSPANFRIHDISILNYGDSIVEQQWNREGGDKPKPWCKPNFYVWGAGTYDVWYKARTANGCLDSVRKDDFLKIHSPKPKIFFSDTSYCQDEPLILIDSTEWKGRSGRIEIKFPGDTVTLRLTNKTRTHNLGSEYYYWSLNHRVRVFEEVQDPYTKEYKTCDEFFPPLFNSEKERFFFQRSTPPFIHETVGNGRITLEFPQLFTSFYWVAYQANDSIRIDSVLTLDMRPYESVKLMAFNGKCLNSKTWSVSSIREASIEKPFSYHSKSQTLRFYSKNQSKEITYTLSAVNGQQMGTYLIEDGKDSWDMESLPSGMYIVSAFIGNEIRVFRFVR